jgi:hypothetical protein
MFFTPDKSGTSTKIAHMDGNLCMVQRRTKNPAGQAGSFMLYGFNMGFW